MSRVEQYTPFDSLKGYREKLQEVAKNRLKVEKPVLSEDQLDALNEIIKSGIERNASIVICYYKNGFIEEIEGRIEKVVFDSIVIEGIRIAKDCIVLASDEIKKVL